MRMGAAMVFFARHQLRRDILMSFDNLYWPAFE
jgi:hypothetical protein